MTKFVLFRGRLRRFQAISLSREKERSVFFKDDPIFGLSFLSAQKDGTDDMQLDSVAAKKYAAQ